MSGDETFPLLSPHLANGAGVVSRLRLAGLDLPVVALRFEGPRSYTGQDSIELQMPGNPVLLDRVVEALIGSGRDRGLDARRAEAGEFTARAFLNERLSLTEAEGVAATIAATSDAELAAARMLASNRLGARAAGWADELAAALALVEAGIDFSDQEDVVAIAPDDLRARLVSLRAEVGRHLDRGVGFEQLHALPWVVLAGPPNAGKSTLFNALLGHERAVVSELAGTTRDVLAEALTVPTDHGDAEVMLVDVAGHEDDPTAVGRRMQTAASEARQRAELTLWCSPADGPCAGPADAVVLCTKSDLGTAEGLAVSAATGAGLDEVRAIIADRLASRAVSLSGDAVALLARHESALRTAAERLDEALRVVDDAAGDELVAASMRAALDAIGALAGHVSPDDVLGRIFASFCVGK